MVITKKRALSIVSSLSTVKQIPEFSQVYEQFKAKDAEFKKKKGCSSCQANLLFSDVADQALSAISSLSRDSMEKLKKILDTSGPIYAYTSNQAGVNLKRLD
jgi:hypothetical protein